MKITLFDRHSYAITQREYTDEGFLKVPGRVARSGIQEYTAFELGLNDRAPNAIIRVMRPENEVFKTDSLQSYQSADVTIEHPSKMVDSETYKNVSVGSVVTGGVQDGDFVSCDLIIKDKTAIDAIESGKVQLSAGYSALYDDDVPNGADYEFIQRDIKINHVALVGRARAGAQARLFDSNHKEKTMKKVMLDSGSQIEIEDDATALLITDSFNRLNKTAEDAKAKADKSEAEKDAMKEELEEEKKKSSDSALNDRLASLVTVKETARKIAGDEFTCDSLSPVDIQRAALTVKRDSIDWAGKSDSYVQAAFDMAAEDNPATQTKSQYDSLSADAAAGHKIVADARETRDKDLGNAWKKNAGESI